MTRSPRRRPGLPLCGRQPDSDGQMLLDGAMLAREDQSRQGLPAGAETSSQARAPVAGPADGDATKQWRDRLAHLTCSGALTPMQEAEFFRLFQAQEDGLREAIPRLLAEVEPHFGSAGEAAAKERFVQALQVLKRQQEEELSRLLASMGIQSRQPGAG